MGVPWLSRFGKVRQPESNGRDIDHPLLWDKDDASMQFLDLDTGVVSSTLRHIGGASQSAMLQLSLTCCALQMVARNHGGWRQALKTDFQMVVDGSEAQASRLYQFLCQFEWLGGRYVVNKAAQDAVQDAIEPDPHLELIEIQFTERGFSAAMCRSSSGSGPLVKEDPFLEGRLVADPAEGSLIKMLPSKDLPTPLLSWSIRDLYVGLTTPGTLHQWCDVLRLVTELLRCFALLGIFYTVALLLFTATVTVVVYWQMPRLLRLLRQTRRWGLRTWTQGRTSLETMMAFDENFPSLVAKMVSEGFLVPLRGAASFDTRFMGPGEAWPKSLPMGGVYDGSGDGFQIVVKYSGDKIHILPLLRQQRHPLFKESLCVPVPSAMTLTLGEQAGLKFDDYMALEKGLQGNPNQLTDYCPVLLPLGNFPGVNYCRAWYTPSPALPPDHPYRWKLFVVNQDKFLLLLNSNAKLFNRNTDI